MKKIETIKEIKVPVDFKIVQQVDVKYQSDDGSLFDNESDAVKNDENIRKSNERKIFLSSIPTIDCTLIESIFLSDMTGCFYYVQSKNQLVDLIKALRYEIPKLDHIKKFPCWVYLQDNDGGDYRNWTTICTEQDIFSSIEEIKKLFDKILSRKI